MRKTASALLICVVVLISLGIVMLASTSSVRAVRLFDDPFHFLKRQLIWLVAAAVAGGVVARVDYHWWQRLWIPFTLTALVLLAAVLIPGLGAEVGGSKRWMALGPLRFQPSEMAKIAVVVGMSAWFAKMNRRSHTFLYGLIYPCMGLGAFIVLILREPDFGTTLLVTAVGMVIMFVAGTRVAYLVVSGALGLTGFILLILQNPNRMYRLFAFLWPERYPESAYHLMQSEAAFIHGGPLGVGLGESIQKQFYLPEAHTDFILAIIGEELGMLATGGVVTLFFLVLWCGLRISYYAPDAFGRFMALGLTTVLVMQAAINVGVVTGCLPTKGLPLPFISYGGSSMVGAVVCLAMLLNIASQANTNRQDHTFAAIKNKGHHF